MQHRGASELADLEENKEEVEIGTTLTMEEKKQDLMELLNR